MMVLIWILGVLRRRPLRVAGATMGVALSVALLAAIALFLADASRSMTARAVAAVPIDWQVQLVGGADVDTIGKAIREAVQVAAVRRVRYADVGGFEAQTSGTTQTTGAGQVIAFDRGYQSQFSAEIRPLSGAAEGVLIAQQTAANLHVSPGDIVTIKRPGLAPEQVTIAGVVDLPDADALFQTVGLPPQAAPQAPPDNVMLLPEEDWLHLFGPQREMQSQATRLQLHVRIARDALPSDPTSAYAFVSGAKRNLEASVAGQALVADNIGARLDAVREDSLYASVLFLFLGVPGIVLAVALTFAVAWSGSVRRRMEQALLRVRGATARQIVGLYSVEASVVAIAGTVVGTLGTILFVHVAPNLRDAAEADKATLIAVAAAGLLLGFAAILFPVWCDSRWTTLSAARRAVTRSGTSLWQRLGLDIVLLAAAGLFFWQTAETGYQIVLAPEGVAAISVDYKAFIAPGLFWIGIALLTLRLVTYAIAGKGRLLQTIVTPTAGRLAPIVAAALSRQSRRLAIGIAMAALAIAFATSTAVFNTTYNAQARVDAELTNGSEVTVFGTSARPAGTHLAGLAMLPAVAAAEPMQHRFTYVGADLQDLYGIDPTHLQSATSLSDAYFSGTAADMLNRLATTPDAALVSEETVQDFQLQEGDTINLRLMNAADHQYRPVPFRFVGVAREFPTAPRDSFIVANAAYVARMTGSDASEYVLMRSKGDPAELAKEAKSLLAYDPSLKVKDIGQAAHLIGSSLTAIDLSGLTTIELTFAAVMAAAAAGLMLALGFTERRRNFAILSAIGAKPAQLASFLWSEGLLVLLGGICFGLLSGLVTAWILVKLLTGVFDPPPELPSIPWIYLATVIGIVAASVAAAVIFARPPRSHDIEHLRDL